MFQKALNNQQPRQFTTTNGKLESVGFCSDMSQCHLLAWGIILYHLYHNQSGYGLSTRGFQQALVIRESNARI